MSYKFDSMILVLLYIILLLFLDKLNFLVIQLLVL